MKKDMICPKCGELGFSRASVYVTNGDLKCEHCGEWNNEHKWEPLLSWKEYRADLTAANQEKVNALSALAQIKEVITLAAAPLGITGEPGEVVVGLGDHATAVVEHWKETDERCGELQVENGTLRAQLLIAREQGRREGWIQGVRDAENEAAGCHSLTSAITAIKWLALSPKGEVCEDTMVCGGGDGTGCDHPATKGEVCQWVCDSPNEYKTKCGHTRPVSLGYPLQGCPYCSRPIHIKEG